MRKALITGFAIGVALAVVGSVATPARATYPGANVSGRKLDFSWKDDDSDRVCAPHTIGGGS